MPTAPTAITALPTPPQRSDSANFAARGDAFLTALPTFRTETNNLGTNVYNNAVEVNTNAAAAATSATNAANSAAAASSSAQAAALSANVTLWVSGSTHSTGSSVYSPITFLTYRRTSSSPGSSTTDPSADTTRWQLISGTVTQVAVSGGTTGLTVSGSPITTTGTITISGTLATANGGTNLTSFNTNGAMYATSSSVLTTGTLPVAAGGTGVATLTANNVVLGNGTNAVNFVAPGTVGNVLTSDGNTWTSAVPSGIPPMVVVTGTTQTAVKLNHYVLTNAAATTLTLPATPTAGDVVWITVANARRDNVIARNGSNILSLAENMTLDVAYAAVELRFVNSTIGWAFH